MMADALCAGAACSVAERGVHPGQVGLQVHAGAVEVEVESRAGTDGRVTLSQAGHSFLAIACSEVGNCVRRW